LRRDRDDGRERGSGEVRRDEGGGARELRDRRSEGSGEGRDEAGTREEGGAGEAGGAGGAGSGSLTSLSSYVPISSSRPAVNETPYVAPGSCSTTCTSIVAAHSATSSGMSPVKLSAP